MDRSRLRRSRGARGSGSSLHYSNTFEEQVKLESSRLTHEELMRDEIFVFMLAGGSIRNPGISQ
jgi:hypothetical protein